MSGDHWLTEERYDGSLLAIDSIAESSEYTFFYANIMRIVVLVYLPHVRVNV